ncbi:uncharacterized protein SPAPADRAFT_52418 [Spathaspora passalidarum NRRL Y-27907]|uniref:Uncharacterized protein n=1 Tax=Spathaspora passalidarum (strain NRRL Y-27907 / 11-Y1) TaxID=619300 RepID=G3ATU7_SPAPN|nr:uncharacterized protein SPAPADRAFT_52418 [Spathaspora passalidarum NRRL Y-27907]EGW30323.1 hypothetical protein SPAPADRAFT_52418 [Spathaspora passalidarum NRRL Y-27907]
MDFEERLEEAEQLDAPSLVGSSLRSADDSIHNNYIHPEKYHSTAKSSSSSKFSQSISASLDDLINEGALLASEEDFDNYLDTDGSVKPDIKFEPIEEKADEENSDDKDETEKVKQPETKETDDVEESNESNTASGIPSSPVQVSEAVTGAEQEPTSTTGNSLYENENYSTPNLSEYQLENEIKDHSQLLESVKSYDHNKLPRSEASTREHSAGFSPAAKKSITTPQAVPQRTEGLVAVSREGIHSPFFYTDRPRSRSRSANPPGSRSGNRSSSRSSSSLKPHLARGDSYKNTNVDEPSKYELPPDLALQKEKEEGDSESVSVQSYEGEVEEEEEEDRRTRYSRPTMGESIAAAEAAAAALKAESSTFKANAPPATQFGMGNYDEKPITRDPSLVTTGDYTNFEVDSPRNALPPTSNLYGARSASSTNYLRSISRSRSRARTTEIAHGPSLDDKNDANPHQLQQEGALISDDPYASIDELDTMVEEVLHGKPANEEEEESKKEILDKVGGIGLDDDKEPPSVVIDEPAKEENDKEKVKAEKEEEQQVTKEEKTDEEPKAKEEVIEPESKEVEEVIEPESKEAEKVIEPESKEAEKVIEPESKEVEEEAVLVEKPTDSEKEKEHENVAVEEETESKTKEVEVAPVAKEDDITPVGNKTEEPFPVEKEVKSESKELEVTPVEKEAESEPKEEPEVETTAPKESPVVDDDLDDLDISPEELRKHLESLPIYLFTSLAGGMQIMPRTNRLVTILNANGIKFEYRDLGTDEEAKKIWKRQAGGKTLPGIVRGDDFIGNWHDIDEANEEYKLHELLYETL